MKRRQSMARSFRVLLVILVLFIAMPVALFAQRATASDLSGTIHDESGAVLPGVTVTATNAATNQTRTAVSDKEGRYYIGALPPGVYTISTELAGFAAQQRKGIRLQIGQLAEMNFTLRPGTTESIVITARSPVIDPTQTTVSTVVGQEQIDALPTNGRNFLSFSVITPGVTFDRTPQQGASATSGLTFGGPRARSNNIMVDGVDNNDPIVGAVRATFSQEAIQEFQVLTNSYSAEFGKATGGIVNIITRSGTNETLGNVFEFFRNDRLNSKGHFERFDVFGQLDRSAEGAVPAEPVRLHPGRTDQARSDVLLSLCRESVDSGEQLRDHRSGGRRSAEQERFSHRVGERSLRCAIEGIPREDRSSVRAGPQPDGPRKLRESDQSEHRAVRRNYGEEPRRRAES